jgi:ribonuclease D
MIHYARLDTHYLLEIFDRLRADIHQKALSMGLSPE